MENHIFVLPMLFFFVIIIIIGFIRSRKEKKTDINDEDGPNVKEMSEEKRFLYEFIVSIWKITFIVFIFVTICRIFRFSFIDQDMVDSVFTYSLQILIFSLPVLFIIDRISQKLVCSDCGNIWERNFTLFECPECGSKNIKPLKENKVIEQKTEKSEKKENILRYLIWLITVVLIIIFFMNN